MKKFIKKTSKKNNSRGKEIKIDAEFDQSNKIHHVTGDTRLLGTGPKVYRSASPGQGLAKWKRR